jgi:hypothetical protein
MDQGDRIKKIATGVSVSDAIDAYMQELADGGEELDREEAKTRELLAIVEVMFLMAAVDGEVQDDEIAQLRASVEALADMREIPKIRIEKTLDELNEKLAADGWKKRLEEASAELRTPDARAFAFRLAAGVAFVDDFVAHAEAAAIDSLAKALALEKADSQAILREVHETLFGG